ncbi:hypothetical protein PYCC9005_004842 [Savitreella phatthalungensis]
MAMLLLLLFVTGTWAFGAGNIPSYGALEGVAFRHGDIEDILLTMALAPASGFLSSFTRKKFNEMTVKRVYFGNWLRDMSQAIDVGTLAKGLDAKTIALLVWVMAFMDFGYATEEFEVTQARLGVYRPEEHIDNPKGYPNPEEPDARKFDARLRGPVSSRELQVDPQTGMKRYIADEQSGHMTSSAFVRNSLVRAIELGREYRQTDSKPAKYESLRLLGQAMHTLEDFSAHSNYCELVLIELGLDVFAHCGEATTIMLGNHRVFPLTTGTFGGLDFVHSLLGEATDKLSQTQIDEVSNNLASSSQQNSGGLLQSLFTLVNSLPTSTGLTRDLQDMQSVAQEADSWRSREALGQGAPTTDVDAIVRKIYPVMAFRDRFAKGLSALFDKIPGLNTLIDKITETVTLFVLSTIQPFVKPVVERVTGTLQTGSALVTSNAAQNEVFDNPHSSDPTHSMLAKDHFSCYLNNPAGLVAQAVVRHTVERVTAAWADTSINPFQVIDEILEVFHHPALPTGRTPIQREMRSIVERWCGELGPKRGQVLRGLSREGVRRGEHHEGGSKAHSHLPNRPQGASRDFSTGPTYAASAGSAGSAGYTQTIQPIGANTRYQQDDYGGHAPSHGSAFRPSQSYQPPGQPPYQSPDPYHTNYQPVQDYPQDQNYPQNAPPQSSGTGFPGYAQSDGSVSQSYQPYPPDNYSYATSQYPNTFSTETTGYSPPAGPPPGDYSRGAARY